MDKVGMPGLDLLLAPITLCSAALLKAIRRYGVHRMPVSRAILDRVGVLPVRDHYYEPFFRTKGLRQALDGERHLPGIQLNVAEQLELLASFSFEHELQALPVTDASNGRYYYLNPNFGPGDAEFLYSIIRLKRPKRLIEVGSGMSTLMAREAIEANQRDDPAYRCAHTCIEPYEMPWLEKVAGVQVLRSVVEDVPFVEFERLERNDILFIDSSHVVRPQGDVLFLFLEVLPRLSPGVLVHVHDVFTPRDYPAQWLVHERRLWTEQYLLEAFLTLNGDFRIIGALNYLAHSHPAEISAKLPVLGSDARYGPGSLWLQRVARSGPI